MMAVRFSLLAGIFALGGCCLTVISGGTGNGETSGETAGGMTGEGAPSGSTTRSSSSGGRATNGNGGSTTGGQSSGEMTTEEAAMAGRRGESPPRGAEPAPALRPAARPAAQLAPIAHMTAPPASILALTLATSAAPSSATSPLPPAWHLPEDPRAVRHEHRLPRRRYAEQPGWRRGPVLLFRLRKQTWPGRFVSVPLRQHERLPHSDSDLRLF